MQLRELKIEISEELLDSLKKASEEHNTTEGKLAGELIEQALKEKTAAPAKSSLPGVALVKNNFVPEITPGQVGTKTMPAPEPSPTTGTNNHQRRIAIEAKMKEISMLIDTAENQDKREEYVQLYAQLATELNSML